MFSALGFISSGNLAGCGPAGMVGVALHSRVYSVMFLRRRLIILVLLQQLVCLQVPKENIWDKRKEELKARDTPSPPTESLAETVEGTASDGKRDSEERGSGRGSRRGRGRARPDQEPYVAGRGRSRGGASGSAPRYNRR